VLPLQTTPIVIGANAFVGVRAIVLPGISIGERAVIGAGAVVTKSVSANTIVAGNPARVIATRAL
jgi:acetyltransferase-like isoleucine patch superfamily enzyme